MRGHWHNEDGALCELHAPDDEEGDLNSNETDVPENCAVCGRLCEYTLTTDGIRYVMDHVREAIAEWPAGQELRATDPEDYYSGSRRIEVVRDWVIDLKSYSMSDDDQELLSNFLALTA